MYAIAILLVLLLISLTITRIATIALTLTGLSNELARFQARSAYTGCGFTTVESEQITNHPVRRRIIMILMLLGNAGLVTVVSTFILAFVGPQDKSQWALRLGILLAGVVCIWLLSRSSWFSRGIERLILIALRKWTKVDVRDYVHLFRLSSGFSICEMKVDPEDWVAEKTLAQLDLPAEGITVLGIIRPSGYVGVPRGETRIHVDDILVLYGQTPAIDDLDTRRRGPAGDRARKEAVQEEADRLKEQEAAEERQEEVIDPD